MKHHPRILWSAAAGLLMVLAAPLAAVCAASASSVASLAAHEYLITLNVQNTPLGAVLEKIEADTDLKFNIDEQWKDVPVSVTLEKIPLDKALQRILVNLNNVVIYGSNDQVKIVVFEKQPPAPPPVDPPGRPSRSSPHHPYRMNTGRSPGIGTGRRPRT
jgi:type II secretory pathway component GspD/PulD (secretin)